jgi:hypothetical protein
MTLPTNEEISNRELSIEELDAIAAGGWLGDAYRWVKHEVKDYVHDKINEYKTEARLFKDMFVETGRMFKHLF